MTDETNDDGLSELQVSLADFIADPEGMVGSLTPSKDTKIVFGDDGKCVAVLVEPARWEADVKGSLAATRREIAKHDGGWNWDADLEEKYRAWMAAGQEPER